MFYDACFVTEIIPALARSSLSTTNHTLVIYWPLKLLRAIFSCSKATPYNGSHRMKTF